MVTKFSNKMILLTENSKVLIVGTLENKLNNIIDTYFTRKECVELNENTIEILNENLYHQYDMVIYSLTQETFDLFKNNINFFAKHSIVLIEHELYSNFSYYINSIASLVVLPIQEEIFVEKIYNVLCINETNKLLHSKEKIINKYKNDETNININEFLDKYHGSIMFLNEDLNDNCNRLKDLEISQELFRDISSNILKLNNILKNNESFRKLSNTFSKLSDFLVTLDLESIPPQNYTAFDYLTTIVADITIYLDELFVYKLFKDVHVFEDSLENNIQYFEDSLFDNEQEEDDNLEFF